MASVPPDPLAGRTIGRVTLQARLGAGAMGLVYKAWHEQLKREVAVKFLTASTGNSRERFLREGKAAAAINHRNVVRILDAGEVDGRPYLVLEYVPGRSLGELQDAQAESDRAKPPTGRPPGGMADLAVVCRLGMQTAEGLAAIHAAGFVHRDIKPDNILVAGDGTAKVADLGLAKQLDSPESLRLTGTGMVVGTPLYVSPEGIRDPASIAMAADIYGLGACLHHLLAGAPPFNGHTPYDVMRAHLEDPPRPLGQIRGDVSQALEDLILRCLAKQPEKRPSAALVAAELRAILKGSAPASRQPLGLALGLSLAAVATVVVALVLWWLAAPGTSQPIGESLGRIQVTVPHSNVLVRLDGGPWSPLPPAGIPAASGPHRLDLRADQPGPWLGFSREIQVGESLSTAVLAELSRMPLAQPLRHPLTGEGMAMIDGLCFGLDPQVAVRFAGTYHLGRWSGTTWTSQVIEVDAAGVIAAQPVSQADRPQGPAWWRAVDDDGQPCPPHHVLSWWAADRLRQRLQLPAPPGWQAQGDRPEQPAQEFGPLFLPAIIRACADAGLGQIPPPSIGQPLARLLRNPLWVRQGERLEVSGGTSRLGAFVVLVP